VLPDRSANAHRNDRRQALPLLRGGKDEQSKVRPEETKGEMAMISLETQANRLLRKTASLLNSVAEAAWTNDTPSPARWDLHRIGTAAYLARRDILVTLDCVDLVHRAGDTPSRGAPSREDWKSAAQSKERRSRNEQRHGDNHDASQARSNLAQAGRKAARDDGTRNRQERQYRATTR
jgi:hypothetical protein